MTICDHEVEEKSNSVKRGNSKRVNMEIQFYYRTLNIRKSCFYFTISLTFVTLFATLVKLFTSITYPNIYIQFNFS